MHSNKKEKKGDPNYRWAMLNKTANPDGENGDQGSAFVQKMESALAFNRNDASFLDTDPLNQYDPKRKTLETDEEAPDPLVQGREKLTKEQKQAFAETLFKKGIKHLDPQDTEEAQLMRRVI